MCFKQPSQNMFSIDKATSSSCLCKCTTTLHVRMWSNVIEQDDKPVVLPIPPQQLQQPRSHDCSQWSAAFLHVTNRGKSSLSVPAVDLWLISACGQACSPAPYRNPLDMMLLLLPSIEGSLRSAQHWVVRISSENHGWPLLFQTYL